MLRLSYLFVSDSECLIRHSAGLQPTCKYDAINFTSQPARSEREVPALHCQWSLQDQGGSSSSDYKLLLVEDLSKVINLVCRKLQSLPWTQSGPASRLSAAFDFYYFCSLMESQHVISDQAIITAETTFWSDPISVWKGQSHEPTNVIPSKNHANPG
jgi:hypothetical protein